MPSIRMSDLKVKNIVPSDKQVTYWDESLASFGLMVSPGGTKTWTLMVGKARKRITIGRYPILSLSVARAEARKRLAEITLGRSTSPAMPLKSLIERFEGDIGHRRPRTQEGYKWLLSRLPKHFTVRTVSEITTAHVTDVIKGMAPSVRSHLLGVLKILFRYAIRNGFTDRNPIATFSVRPSKPRTRILTTKELKAIWHSLGTDTYGTTVKLLMLTGQRKKEVQHFEYADNIIVIPEDYCKNGKQHAFPAGEMTKKLLGQNLTYYGWSKAKARLDKASGVSNWTLHDLRRTYATIHASLGTPIHVIERLLNHSSGTFAGVTGTYNRFAYFPDMKKAVDSYEAHIETLLRSG